MTNQDYKAILTALRDEIRGRKRDMEIGRHADPIDQIIDQQNRDQNATLASNDRARLREIEAALLRIADGSYAECIDCRWSYCARQTQGAAVCAALREVCRAA